MADERTPRNPANPNPDWQDRDIWIRPLVWTILAVLLFTLLAFLGMGYLMRKYNRAAEEAGAPLSPLAAERTLPPAPRLQVDARGELAAHRAAERALIDRYEWISRDTGLAKVPIERAMQIVAEHGVPAFAAPPAGPAGAGDAQEEP